MVDNCGQLWTIVDKWRPVHGQVWTIMDVHTLSMDLHTCPWTSTPVHGHSYPVHGHPYLDYGQVWIWTLMSYTLFMSMISLLSIARVNLHSKLAVHHCPKFSSTSIVYMLCRLEWKTWECLCTSEHKLGEQHAQNLSMIVCNRHKVYKL